MKRLLMILLGAIAIGMAAYAQPTISAVQDAAAYTANVAQGGVFVVKGTNMSGAGFTQATAPYPPSINGVKITFTPVAGGAGTDAYMVYTYNLSGVNQLAGLLPSTVAPGSYNVTVTNGTAASAGFKTTVMARKFGLITIDSSGSGGVVAQNYISASQLDINRYTTGTLGPYTTSPGKPSQYITAWGTGMGGITKPDNDNPGVVNFLDQGVDVKVIVGGQTVTPIYAGRAPQLPGADQINFQLPANVATGCNVSLQVSVAGQLSNQTTIAIAPNASATACVSPQFTSSQLQRLDQGGTVTVSDFGLTQFTTSIVLPGLGSFTAKSESAFGAFTKFTGAQLGSALSYLNPSGACYVYRRTGTSSTVILGPTSSDLDAGNPITLTGPNSLNKGLARGADNTYSLSLGTAVSGIPVPIPGFNPNPTIVPGTFNLAGPGGADVGPFTASVTVGPTLTTNNPLPATVPRSQNLTLGWTGGNPSDTVVIEGISGVLVSGSAENAVYDTGVFVCTTTADKLTFTVPTSVLQQLPVTPSDPTTGIGMLMLLGVTTPTASNGIFTAPLVAGGSIDAGFFQATIGYQTLTQYQ